MEKFNIMQFADTKVNNKGMQREWALCKYYGIERTRHDNVAYDEGSDIELAEHGISVKSAKATLMCGSKCRGCHTFEGIWRRYRRRVHSDQFAYVTSDFEVFMMSLDEFSKFVHKFATLSRESTRNGGDIKIQFLSESKKMREWLEMRVA